MAGASKDKQLAREIYTKLQAVSCPLVEGLYLQEEESMLQLLCSPSQHRTDLLAWICSSINPHYSTCKVPAARSKDPEQLTKEMALLGQELMLCKATDLDLIRGAQSPLRQLQFMKRLLSLVPGSGNTQTDVEPLLNELYSPEGLPQLRLMLTPALDPWPAHMRALNTGTKPSVKPTRDEAEVRALLLSTQSALDQLRSECEFLKEPQTAGSFSSSALRVAAGDLQQMMATFSHVYETDLKSYCNRAPPGFSPDISVFQRVHQLLSALNTELETLDELSEVSEVMTEEVRHLQSQPRYWSRGAKHTLPDQLEALSRRYRDFLSLLRP